jgi:hypothetical protein
MFEHMLAEELIANYKNTYREDDCIDPFMRPIQVRPSIIDRVLLVLGDTMISVGLKLKYRPHASLTPEGAHAPNFIIML